MSFLKYIPFFVKKEDYGVLSDVCGWEQLGYLIYIAVTFIKSRKSCKLLVVSAEIRNFAPDY